ncbi:MAG TPA: hypothetical protein VE592_10105, partial [Geminicoccaceae bacterium]|nr:hypothetical protein [Geminicoccaceae bacterium]
MLVLRRPVFGRAAERQEQPAAVVGLAVAGGAGKDDVDGVPAREIRHEVGKALRLDLERRRAVARRGIHHVLVVHVVRRCRRAVGAQEVDQGV